MPAIAFLLSSGIAPRRITIAGDSAGGGLVVGAMLAIREAGLPLPGCGWGISPWVDMEATGASFTDQAAEDPTVQKAILEMAGHYLGGADPRHPHASPMHGDLRGLAPLLIQVGAAETLLDDAARLARLAGAADVACHAPDLAGDDPCVARLPPATRGRAQGHRQRWRLHQVSNGR